MSNDELAYQSLTSIAAQIRERKLSPVEVVDDSIARIERLNPALNAVILEGFGEAREHARRAEGQVMSGKPLGPLHGVPVLMKDCLDFKTGWRNTFGGVRRLRDYVADYYTTFPQRVEDAGGIILGKTNSPVFGFRGTCDNYLFGPTHNPFDLSRENSGGSSGGSAAAVAAGFVPMAGGGRRWRVHSNSCRLVRGGWLQAVLWPSAAAPRAQFVRRHSPVSIRRGRSPARWPMPPWRSMYWPAAAPATRTATIRPEDFVAATGRSIKGMRIAYSPNFGIYPSSRPVDLVVKDAIRALGSAAHRSRKSRLIRSDPA